MNYSLKVYLLSLVGPAIALGVFVLFERRREKTTDDVEDLVEKAIVHPKIRLMPPRKL